MIIYKADDFSEMKFNVWGLEIDMLNSYPELKVYPEFDCFYQWYSLSDRDNFSCLS